ncbi:MAG: DUF721 domain-containing protein [Bacteroidales bacterium]|nr:DUF721 domain-containing protein [Bacteroidales bacterium]
MKMKKAETLGDVLQQYLAALGADKKLNEIRVLNEWEKIVGKTISRETADIYLKDGVLFLKFRSPLIRNEVNMHKTIIQERINESLGYEAVNSIKIK